MPKQANKGPAIIGFRPHDALLKRLRAHVLRMNAAMPGIKHSLSDAMRTLLTTALDDAECAVNTKGKVRS